MLTSLDATELRVGDEGVVAVARGCDRLVNLNIAHCRNVGPEAWAAFADHDLHSIDLRGCDRINADDLAGFLATTVPSGVRLRW